MRRHCPVRFCPLARFPAFCPLSCPILGLSNLLGLRHFPCYQVVPETIRLANRPFEPKEVGSFSVMVVLNTEDDGDSTIGMASVAVQSYVEQRGEEE